MRKIKERLWEGCVVNIDDVEGDYVVLSETEELVDGELSGYRITARMLNSTGGYAFAGQVIDFYYQVAPPTEVPVELSGLVVLGTMKRSIHYSDRVDVYRRDKHAGHVLVTYEVPIEKIHDGELTQEDRDVIRESIRSEFHLALGESVYEPVEVVVADKFERSTIYSVEKPSVSEDKETLTIEA